MMGGKRKLEGIEGPVPSKSCESPRAPLAHPMTMSSSASEISGDEGESSPPTTGSEVEAEAANLELQHPLLNEVILRNIFTQCSGDLKVLGDCRLVSKIWKDASLPTWRSIATPKVYFSAEPPSYFLSDVDGERTPLDEFLDDFMVGDEGRTMPYHQFHLRRWVFHEEGEVDATASRFWEVVGRQLTQLKLGRCKSAKPENFYRVMNQLCPNLETLILDRCEFCDRDVWDKKVEEEDEDEAEYKEPVYGEHPNLKSLQLLYNDLHVSDYLRVTYLELLSNFPHLTSFKLDSYQLRLEIIKFLKAVKLVRKEDPRRLPITQIATEGPVFFKFWDDIETIRRDKMLALLQELRIALQFLLLTLGTLMEELQTIIQVNGPKLTTLIASPASKCDFPFGVQLPNLDELIMPEGFCRTLEFIGFTPNLTKLRIWVPIENAGWRADFQTTLILNASKSALANTRLWKLRALNLEDFTMSVEDLRCLVKWMPCVRILTISLDNKQFGIVCDAWTELVRLQVRRRNLTDEGLLGTGAVEQAVGLGAPITRLQKLEVFEVPESMLTDASIWNGILKLPCIRRIFLLHRIGDEAKEALDQRRILVSEFDIPGL